MAGGWLRPTLAIAIETPRRSAVGIGPGFLGYGAKAAMTTTTMTIRLPPLSPCRPSSPCRAAPWRRPPSRTDSVARDAGLCIAGRLGGRLGGRSEEGHHL